MDAIAGGVFGEGIGGLRAGAEAEAETERKVQGEA